MNDDIIKHLPLLPKNDPIVFGEIDGYQLAAPQSFWQTSYDLKRDLINGCGPKGIGDYLVPDSIWFLSVKAACKIHDWMYLVYNCEKGFKLSNQLFLDNMNRINKTHSGNWFFNRREKGMKFYSNRVNDLGRLFYYDNHIGIYNGEQIIMTT